MRIQQLFTALVMTAALLFAFSASAQQQVMFQQRFFEDFGDGSTGPNSTPCCDPGSGTYDTRSTGQNGGAYFAEFFERTQTWYGTYNAGTGGVTIPQGAFTTDMSQMLISPGGNLLQLTTFLNRTVQDLVFQPGGGPGNFIYSAGAPANAPSTPTFRSAGTFVAPNNAGVLSVTAGVAQYGGTRAIIHEQNTTGADLGTVPGLVNEFFFPVANGPGVPFTAMNIVRRETRSAPFNVRLGSINGPIQFMGLGTGWFTMLPYTTGTVMVDANTIGTSIMDFTTRTDVGFNNIVPTAMGGITGQLQLVSGHLLNSRGGSITNLGGTNATLITFTPEPTSAALLGAGALGLIGLIASDRRKNRN